MATVSTLECQRSDCLFHDPWAAALAGTVGKAWIEHRTAESVVLMVIQMHYFDDFLQRVVDHEVIQ